VLEGAVHSRHNLVHGQRKTTKIKEALHPSLKKRYFCLIKYTVTGGLKKSKPIILKLKQWSLKRLLPHRKKNPQIK
jgi:hypothetical protein